MRKNAQKCAAWLLLCACMALLTGCVAKSGVAAVETFNEPVESPVKRYRRIREKLRADEKAQLNDIAHSGGDAELTGMAQKELIEICRRDEQESTCEGILEMRGFSDPVVTVHADSVNVVLSADAVTAQECAVILELIVRETGAAVENVKIIPINSSNRIALSQGI